MIFKGAEWKIIQFYIEGGNESSHPAKVAKVTGSSRSNISRSFQHLLKKGVLQKRPGRRSPRRTPQYSLAVSYRNLAQFTREYETRHPGIEGLPKRLQFVQSRYVEDCLRSPEVQLVIMGRVLCNLVMDAKWIDKLISLIEQKSRPGLSIKENLRRVIEYGKPILKQQNPNVRGQVEGSFLFHSNLKDGLMEAIHNQYVKMIQVSPTVLYWMLVKEWTEWEPDVPLLRLRGRIKPFYDELEQEWVDYKEEKREIFLPPPELHEMLLGTFYMAVMSDIMNHPVGSKDREYSTRVMDATSRVVIRNSI